MIDCLGQNQTQTLMACEALQAPDCVASQLSVNQAGFSELVRRMPLEKIRLVMTCARGSSDHAASYGKYLIETRMAIPVSSAPPSIASLYQVSMNLKDVLFILVSQSGRSPDLVANAKWAKENGAFVLAFVNDVNSPVAEQADMVISLEAGKEVSVAATKSFIASLAAFAQLVASYCPDQTLASALPALPEILQQSQTKDWTDFAPIFAASPDLLTIGRGVSYGVAQEAALKFKETSVLHAEAFSSAEVRHGPLGLLRDNMPFLVFSQNDECRKDLQTLVSDLRQRGARVFWADQADDNAFALPVVPDLHPALAPIAAVSSFYQLANTVALLRGYDPDKPKHLKKVTETV
jgi:glucosamine--fructose-6-phosphate aminotransferase (isomerizing)